MADNNQMKEILAKLDEGVKSLFESDKYAEYLSVMSRFHNYSTRNTLLIYAQKPDAQRVAGYQSWRHNFNRQVKKGERGIKIFAPLPFAETKEFEKLDPETKQPVLDERGQPVMETLMRMGARFKAVSVFDVSQTDGEPLPELAETLTGDVERYELFMDALHAVSPLPIVFEPMSDNQDGYCAFGDKIAIREGMSEVQTISALIHEVTHAKLDERQKNEPDLSDNSEQDIKPRNRRDDEITAESVSYVVCQKFGIETGANSFGYVSSWSRTSELNELHASLDNIRKIAAELIDGIDEKYRALAKERGIDLTLPVPQLAAEVSVEQNYNMIDGVINNEPEQTVDEPQNDPIRERLTAMSQAETPDAKYAIAFSALVDALCANEELLAVAATGEGWQKGAGRAAVFDGEYFETLIDTYSAELIELLSDRSMFNRLNNTIKGEVYRRLDAIAYDRFILDEYADITKSGRLEIYEKPFPEGSTGILVCLTEQLPDGNVHDYGSVFGYYPDDHEDHSINNYLSLKSFAELRESVFGKSESAITLNYKETELVGSMVLRRLLYTDGMFNRELKRTRVEVLPPMGKYSVYAQHLSGVIGDDTLIHVGTDSGYLIPLGVSRTRFEEHFIEAQIDSIFEKAPTLLEAALAESEQFVRFEWGAITGRISEVEEHNAPVRKLREEKDRMRHEEAVEAEKEEKRQKSEKYDARIDEIATSIEKGKSISVGYSEYEFDGKNPVLDLFKLYGVNLPLRTQGWVNTGLAEISESGYRYYSSKHKGNSTAFSGYLLKLREAIKTEPIDVKRGRSTEQNNESKDGGGNMEYSELQKQGFEYARQHAHLPLDERLNLIAQTFGVKSASVYTQPCTGKYRGQSDIMLRLEGGGTIGIGLRGNAAAKKDSTINECVNNALAKYNPVIVAEAKARATAALRAREATDNRNAEERGLKPYKFLNVELSDGGIGNGHTGWYYATIAVDNKVIGFVTSDLASDIERGVLSENITRANYFVAGGLKDEDVDFVFNNVGHSSIKDSYTAIMSAAARERAEKTLTEINGTKQPQISNNSLEHRLYSHFAEIFPDVVNEKYSYMKLESEGYEPLSIECIGDNRISVMHTYKMNGDLMYDPMIVFEIDKAAGTLTAVEFEQSMPPLYQRVTEGGRDGQSIDGNGNERTITNLQGKINDFAAKWFDNIESQEYLPITATLADRDEDARIDFDKNGEPIMPEAEPQKQTSLDIMPPDPTVGTADMHEYGYTAEELLPLSQAQALTMFDANNTAIYLLYPDDTEAMALDREEIEQFDGLFGIEKVDWERLQALKTPITTENSRESELLHNTPGMFGIYQIRDDIDVARDFCFAPMRELEALGLAVDRTNYELVYAAPLDIHDRQTNLHKIFADFQAENPERPAEYAGRSVSVSDVIVMQWRGEVSAHFVDSIGFKELPHFTGEEREQPKTPEREAVSSKQTFSQLDKRPTVSKGKPDFLAKIEANKQRVARDGQSPIQKNAEREVLT